MLLFLHESLLDTANQRHRYTTSLAILLSRGCSLIGITDNSSAAAAGEYWKTKACRLALIWFVLSLVSVRRCGTLRGTAGKPGRDRLQVDMTLPSIKSATNSECRAQSAERLQAAVSPSLRIAAAAAAAAIAAIAATPRTVNSCSTLLRQTRARDDNDRCVDRSDANRPADGEQFASWAGTQSTSDATAPSQRVADASYAAAWRVSHGRPSVYGRHLTEL